MPETFSFDIVSEVDLQEVDNAVNQAKKELAQRFDFKGSKSSIELNRQEKKIMLVGDDDYKLRSLRDILAGRMTKRGISLKNLSFKEPEKAFEGTLRQTAEITSGIPREKARELVDIIKNLKLKIQTQIEGEKVKVSSPKKDDLQVAIAQLKSVDFPLALTFTNYR